MQKFRKAMGLTIFLVNLLLHFILLPVAVQALEPQNILIIGWDGCRRETAKEMIAGGNLPNLKALIKSGRMVDIEITTGATDSKAGWSQILTGYAPDITGIYSNGRYRPIPEGMTILERVEKALGSDKVYTAIIAGQSVNLDNDAPRKVSYDWWIRHSETPGTMELLSPKQRIERIGARVIEEGGKKYVAIPGKIYYLTQKGIDLFKNGLGNNKHTATYAMDTIAKQRNNRFLITILFPEPANSGHKYGEGSREYKNGLKLSDTWTGVIISKLKELKIYDKTLVYVVSNHGFDLGRKTHNKATTIFCATNDILVTRNGNRTDIAPTILKRFGIDPMKFKPALTGNPLNEPGHDLKP